MSLKLTKIKTGKGKQEKLVLTIKHPLFLWKQEMFFIGFKKWQEKIGSGLQNSFH